ncbi:MAG: hypothetical protein ABR599_09480 [Gemmatimonadota bacterium]
MSSPRRLARFPTRALACLGLLVLAGGCRGDGGAERVPAEQAVLEHQIEGLEALLAAAREGPLVRFDGVLVTVHEKLVRDLLGSATPYERIVDDRYRVRVDSALVAFQDGFALVELRGRASLAGRDEQTVFADVSVYGGLEVTGLDATSGQLRARVHIIAFEATRVGALGMEAPVRRLLEDLASQPIEDFNVLASDLEIPIAIERDLTIPQIGPAGEVHIAAATVPLRVWVQDVKVTAGKLWVSIGVAVEQGGGQATRAGAPGTDTAEREEDSATGGLDVHAREGAAAQARGDGPPAAADRIAELRARAAGLRDSLAVYTTSSDTLLGDAALDSGDVALGIRPELVNEMIGEVAALYLDQVELDIPLEEQVVESGEVKVKALFATITAGEWRVFVTIHRVRGTLSARRPELTVVGENRLRMVVPARLERGSGSATIRFRWEARNVANVACGDFETRMEVTGSVVPRDYTVTGDFVLAARDQQIVAEPDVPVTKIRVSVSPSAETWRKVRATLASQNEFGKCGIGMKFLSADELVALLTRLTQKGFQVKLPTGIVPTLALPASVRESVAVEGRQVQLSVRPNALRVSPRAFWYSAAVEAGVRPLTPVREAPAGQARVPGGGGDGGD